MKHPVLLLAMPRSGSTMIASIFAANGVEFGSCRDPGKAINPGGCSYENDEIKNALIQRFGRLPQTGEIAGYSGLSEPTVEAIIKRHQEPFGVKVSALYWPAFAGFNEAKAVFITRPKKSVIASWRRMGWKYPESSYDAHIEAMQQAKAVWKNHAVINSDKLVNGDISETISAFKMAGIRLDPFTIHKIIDRSHWHC